MEERDYLKKQINTLGKILEKLLVNLLGKKSTGDNFEYVNQILNEHINISIE